MQISRVDVDGNAAGNDFRLHVAGNGFGLLGFSYDLSARKGVARPELVLQIFDNLDEVKVDLEGEEELSVVSPHMIEAHVVNRPLPPGSYGVRIFLPGRADPIAKAADMFRVEAGGDQPDAEVPPPPVDSGLHPDARIDPQDGGVPEDATPLQDDAQVHLDATVYPDAEPPDAGPPPDSGLGAFAGAFAYRRPVYIDNATGLTVPQDTTVRIAIPHADLVTAGQSQASAADIALYFGTEPNAVLAQHQWDDPHAVNTNNLVMIARLPADVPATGATAALYFGDPTLTVPRSDNVFELIEHFGGGLADWYVANWNRCEYGRPVQARTPGANDVWCALDSDGNPTRRTLATDRGQNNIRNAANLPSPNLTYEFSFWFSARMVTANELFYFAYGAANDDYVNTTKMLPADIIEPQHNATLTNVLDQDNNRRNFEGWRFGTAGAMDWWIRVRLHFTPSVDRPSMHFRYLSNDGVNDANNAVLLDDFQIRLTANPDLGTRFGEIETR